MNTPTQQHMSKTKTPRPRAYQIAMKYTQRMLPEDIKLDLFMVTEDNWGLMMVIRTGPGNYSKNVVCPRAKQAGYYTKGGMVHDQNGQVVRVDTEKKFFELLNMKYQPPHMRH